MKKFFINFLDKTKTQPDIWFFFGFLLTFSLSIRKVLFYFPIQRTFNEYANLHICLSDIFLIMAISLWLFTVLSHTKSNMSRSSLWITQFIHQLYLVLPLLLVFWSFISIFWSQNKILALFGSLKILEFYLLYLYMIFRIIPLFYYSEKKTIVPRGTIFNYKEQDIFVIIIIVTSLFQSFIGIAQFIFQKSLGLVFLKESIISPILPGIAKLVFNKHKIIRAYGLMPHPNILGGFLLFSIIITLLYKQLFHVEQFEDSMIKDQNSLYISFKKWLLRNLWLINAILIIQILALSLSFSKSAIIGLLIALVFIYYKSDKKSKRMFHVEHSHVWLLLFLIFLISSFLIFKPDLNSIFIKSLKERLFYLNVPRGTFLANPLRGVGTGQFILAMPHFYQNVLLPWQFQPIHNVFLLILSELGIIGLIIFVWWILQLFHVEQLSYYDKTKLQQIASLLPLKRKDGNKVKNQNKDETISSHYNNSNCSTWNNLNRKDLHKTFNNTRNLNHSKNNQNLTTQKKETYFKENRAGESTSILYNNYYYLSMIYFQSILLGFIFIMFFDHYLWDIQQGSLMFWMIAGLIIGLKNILYFKFHD